MLNGSGRSGHRSVPQPQSRRRHYLGWSLAVVVLLSSICLMVGGGWLIYRGLQADVEQTMPLPARTYGVTGDQGQPEVDQTPVSALLDEQYEVRNTDTGGDEGAWEERSGGGETLTSISLREMRPGSVLVPDLGIYSEIRGSDEFDESGYSAFYSLRIPANPHRSVWFSAGGPLTDTDTRAMTGFVRQSSGGDSGGQQKGARRVPERMTTGTALVASHISAGRSTRGAFYELHKADSGTLVWTKGFDGTLAAWRISSLWAADHTEFPQSYFSAEGPRQLVLTTCGGRLNNQGYYAQNVFVVARPVPLSESLAKELGQAQG